MGPPRMLASQREALLRLFFNFKKERSDMSTQAQIDANRLNARKSTGPKTEQGRANSAANSTRHGLQANPTTIFENHPHERSQ